MASLPPTDFAGLAHALGFPGRTIVTPEDLDALATDLGGGRRPGGPLLLDVRISRAVVSDRFALIAAKAHCA